MVENESDAAGRRVLRVAFAPGVTPDKWFGVWRERRPDVPLEPVPLEDASEQTDVLHDGRADLALVRLPIERDELHVIPLYEEQQVVVAPKGHAVTAADSLTVAELADEHLLQDPDSMPEWKAVATEIADERRVEVPSLTPRAAIELVSTGAGIVIVPLSVARQYDRKDVIRRPVADVAKTQIGLAWLVQREDDPLVEQFIGVVRGRSARSTRSTDAASAEKEAAERRAAEKKAEARKAAEAARERKHASRTAARRGGSRKRPRGRR